MPRPTVLVLGLLAACYGIPDDTVVDQLRVRGWASGTCEELVLDLALETSARGPCDQVDLSVSSPVDPGTVEDIRSGIDHSDFAQGPVPGATHTYFVRMTSASANASSQARIDPSAELLAAMAPLAPPS